MREIAPDSKIYYCIDKQAVCITKSCPRGNEQAESFEVSRDMLKDFSYRKYESRLIPGEITARLTFNDQPDKIIKGELSLVYGCE